MTVATGEVTVRRGLYPARTSLTRVRAGPFYVSFMSHGAARARTFYGPKRSSLRVASAVAKRAASATSVDRKRWYKYPAI